MRITDSLAMVASLQFGLAGRYDCHVYALRGAGGIVLIDSGGGTETEQVLANLEAEFPGVPLEAVALTHGHPDHSIGAAMIQSRTGCRVIVPFASRAAIESGDESACGLSTAKAAGTYPPDLRMEPCSIHGELRDGDPFEAAGIRFEPIHVRGHSEDAFCLLTENAGRRWLFAGDVLFYGGVLGLINAEGSDLSAYRADLPKLAGLRVDGLFPGHGLFTLRRGQRHIDSAVEQLRKGFVPRCIGQGDLIF